MSVLKATTDMITNIPTRPIRLAGLLAIMSVSTFKIAVILYVSPSDIVKISKLTVILKIIGQHDVKHIIDKHNNISFEVLDKHYHIIGLSAILVIMSFSTLKTTVILYVFSEGQYVNIATFY